MSVTILTGDCRDMLAGMPAESVHTCVTSPPYWGLRDYQIPPSIWGDDPNCEHAWGEEIAVNATNHVDKARWQHTRNGRDEEQPTEKRVSWLRTNVKQGQFCSRCGAWAGAFGLEPSYQLYVDHAVEVFRAVHRVLRDDGTLWLNLGDCYATGAGAVGERPGGGARGDKWAGLPGPNRGHRGQHLPHQSGKAAPRIAAMGPMTQPNRMPQSGLKPKDLCGIPWRVAFALQADGWWLRSDVIWSKPNPMPESAADRPTKAHEYLFLLSKSERYFYDAVAIKELTSENTHARRSTKMPDGWDTGPGSHGSFHRKGREKGKTRKLAAAGSGTKNNTSFDQAMAVMPALRNKRSVWEIATEPFPEAHFATFPTKLVEPCITAGCPVGGTVLDPFGGSGTVGMVADRLGRNAILIEIGAHYVEMARRRIRGDAPLFADVSSAAPMAEAAE